MSISIRVVWFASLLAALASCAPQVRIKNGSDKSPKDSGLFGSSTKIELDLNGVKFDVTTIKNGGATAYQMVDLKANHFDVYSDSIKLTTGSEEAHKVQFTLAYFKKYTFDIEEGVTEAISKTNKNEIHEGKISEDPL